MKTYAIIIVKNTLSIGLKLMEAYDFNGLQVLTEISDMLNNYNKNLVGRDIYSVQLAHRMLEFENIEGNIMDDWGMLCHKSSVMVNKFYNDVYWPSRDKQKETNGKIALNAVDIGELERHASFKAYINLDDNKVKLTRNFIRVETKIDYCVRNKLDDSLFNKETLNVNNTDLSFEEFFFNQTEDIMDFIIGNPNGWRGHWDSLIYSIYKEQLL